MTDRDYRTVEKMLRSDMVQGQMHGTLRDAGRLAGGMLAAGKLKLPDVAALGRLAVELSKNKREGERKWAEAVEYGRGQPVERDRERTAGVALGWDDAIQIGREKETVQPVVDERWIESEELPEPAADWQPGDLIRYLELVFEPDEFVGIVADAWLQEESQRWLPKRGVWDRTRAELVEALRGCTGDIGAVLGDPNPDAGAWIRINPLDGEGCKDANVTAFRHALIEADSDELGKQLALIRALNLPCSAVVHSGGKSLHAIVRVDAANAEEYRARVDRLYEVCAASGLKVDQQCRNPSRLSRLPGILRGGRPQYLVDGRCGLADFDAWAAWIEEAHDDLPDPEPLSGVFFDLPALAPPLVDGILRTGHKARLSGPSKGAKSFGLIELASAIAEGLDWLGWRCRQGPVLYINLELDRASCFHRFHQVYQALGWEPKTISAIDVWNLRGHSVPLDKLTPKLIRRAVGKGYTAVIFDPIYKLSWGDENDAGDVARFCNQLDRICHELGAAVIDAHHHSKGTQGQKRSIDRGSGSGVFGRDPDAILDLIELEITKERRAEVETHLVAQTLGELAARLKVDLDKVPMEARAPAPVFLAAFQMAFPRLQAEAAAAYYDATVLAARMSGWRVEATLREFATPAPARVWFRHPVHIADEWGLLEDAKAAGEEPPWMAERRTKDEARKEKAKELREDLEEAITAAGGTGKATVANVAEELGVTDRAVRKRLAASRRWGCERGVIVER